MTQKNGQEPSERTKGRAITVDDLPGMLETVVSIFPQNEIAKIRNTYQPEISRSLAAYKLHRARAHPLAIILKEIEGDISKSIKLRSFALSPTSWIFLNDMERLLQNAPYEEAAEVTKNAVVPSQVHSSLYEAFIFGIYKQLGIDISIVPVQPQNAQQTPDFVAKCGNDRVFIERKSLEDDTVAEDRIWDQVESRIVKALQKNSRCWELEIAASRPISGKDIDPICRDAYDIIKLGAPSTIQTGDSGFKLRFAPITTPSGQPITPDTWFPGTPGFLQRKRGWIEWEGQIIQNGSHQYRNPACVHTCPYVENDQFNRISAAIDKANSQLHNKGPGVVHVELPYRDGTRLPDVIDPVFQRIFGILPKMPCINAVVISGQIIDSTQAGNPVLHYSAIIPNAKPSKELSNEFSILDTSENDLIKDPGGDEGTICMVFQIGEPLPKQTGKSILYVCDRHGTRQVRLWQSFANRFRVDVVNTSYGRRTFQADLNSLAVNTDHILAFAWSSDAPSMALNGKLLEPIDEHKSD